LGTGETTNHLPGLRVDHHGSHLATRRDRQLLAGDVAQQQAVMQLLPGPDGGGTIRPYLCLVGVEQLSGRLPHSAYCAPMIVAAPTISPRAIMPGISASATQRTTSVSSSSGTPTRSARHRE